MELLPQRHDQRLDGLALPGQLAGGLLAAAGQGASGQPLEGGEQHLLVAACAAPTGEQAGGQAQEQAEQEGEGDGHGATLAAGSDRSGWRAVRRYRRRP